MLSLWVCVPIIVCVCEIPMLALCLELPILNSYFLMLSLFLVKIFLFSGALLLEILSLLMVTTYM